MARPTEDDLLAAVAKTESLHACAEVLSKAFEILRDPDANQLDLVDVIRTDTALTSDIMRISNSAFYGGHSEISSLEDAIHRLGFREVMKLISISLSRQVFNRNLRAYGISAIAFWSECASVASTMECLADLLDEDRSYFFTLGVVHPIGKLVLDQVLESRGESLLWEKDMPLAKWEREILGVDYTEAGFTLLRSWHFPEKIQNVVLCQLHPEQVPDPCVALKCLNFAIRWCDGHRHFGSTVLPNPPSEPWLADLEITHADLEDLKAEAGEVFLQMKHLVGLH